jgi:single stranded DNA-binding protein
MSKSVNKVFLVGNLTRELEMHYTENKKPVCSFGLATNRSWQSYDAPEKHEETEFHRIVAWDKLAETCHQFLRKGRKAHLEGRLHTRVYTDKDEVKREVTEIVLEEWSCWIGCLRMSKSPWISRMNQLVLRYRSKRPARKSNIPRMIESFSSLSFMVRIARSKLVSHKKKKPPSWVAACLR